MNVSDERIIPLSQTIGMQEIIRMFNKEYSKIIGFTINTDYSQNEIYQTCALMNDIVVKFGTQNYTLNRYLNRLIYYLLNNIKSCSDINEYNAYMMLNMGDDLPEDDPNRPV